MSASELRIEMLLRAHAPHTPESLRTRVLALEPKPQRVALPSRRLLLIALPAAAGVAVVAAAVHGLVNPGTKAPSASFDAAAVRSATTPLAQGSASGSSGGAAAPALHAPGAGGTAKSAGPTVGSSSRLQRTDASIQVRVANNDDLARATTRATRIATSLGGYAQSVDYRAPQGGAGESYIELRVPAENVKTALARLAGLGTLVSQELSVSDLQQKLQTQSAQIEQLRRRVTALRAALRDPSLPEAQQVLLRIRLAESKRALAQRLSARKGTVTAGTTARISLVIATEQAIAPVPHHRGRLGRMVHSAAGFLALEAIVVLYALIVISPIALALALVWAWRRRSVERLLAT